MPAIAITKGIGMPLEVIIDNKNDHLIPIVYELSASWGKCVHLTNRRIEGRGLSGGRGRLMSWCSACRGWAHRDLVTPRLLDLSIENTDAEVGEWLTGRFGSGAT
jgi:hypothetical protein